jgi:hypothetical protein
MSGPSRGCPDAVWKTSVYHDGSPQEGYFVAELTGLNTREGGPEGMRLIVPRVRPTRRHLKKLNGQTELADAEPDTMRFRLYHLPARLADHVRRRWLRIDAT